MPRKNLLGLTAITVSAIAFSTKAIFAKLAYRYGADAITVVTLRMVFAAPIYFIVLLAHAPSRASVKAFPAALWKKIAFTGVVGWYASSTLDFIGLQYITAGLERVVLYSYPAIVVVLSAVIYRTRVRAIELFALVGCYVGIFISFWSELSLQGAHTWRGTLLVLACAFTYAMYIVSGSEIISKIGSRTFTSLALLAASIFIFIQFAVTRSFSALIQPAPVYELTAAMAIIATVIPTFLFNYGINHSGPNVAAIVSSIGPVATIGMATTFLGETVDAAQIFGGALVIGAVLILAMRPKTKAQETLEVE